MGSPGPPAPVVLVSPPLVVSPPGLEEELAWRENEAQIQRALWKEEANRAVKDARNDAARMKHQVDDAKEVIRDERHHLADMQTRHAEAVIAEQKIQMELRARLRQKEEELEVEREQAAAAAESARKQGEAAEEHYSELIQESLEEMGRLKERIKELEEGGPASTALDLLDSSKASGAEGDPSMFAGLSWKGITARRVVMKPVSW